MTTSAQRPPDRADLRGFTILVLEDDPDTLELLRAILSACGARVLLADSIQHAKGYLHTLRPDPVVSDLPLPSEDGLAFLRWLRGQRDPDRARIPVVAVTAFYEDYPPTRATDSSAHSSTRTHLDRCCR